MTRLLGLSLLLLIALALIGIDKAMAQTLDGNFLYRQCQLETGIETAYVTGVVDALVISGAAVFTLPENGVVQQNRNIVCNGLEQFPEYRDLDASVLVHAYLAKAFPQSLAIPAN